MAVSIDAFTFHLLFGSGIHLFDLPQTDYSDQKATRIINAELVNTLGNLLSRVCAPSVNKRHVVPLCNLKELKELDHSLQLIKKLKKLPPIYAEHFDAFNFYMAIDEIVATLHLTNNFVQETQPWVLCKDPAMTEKLDATLALTFESLRIIAILLQPIVPSIALKILDKINVDPNNRTWHDTEYQLDTKKVERALGAGSAKLMDRLK